ncbi:hypothetical protein EGR_05487 [Echinococcus granulosus]|uniref:Uncharacterized protein n=1 Tax=Echinococcus granulosus TaxID=6210 RepID=W6UE78_ECHGR|nr:hypothetical protein EGR_05487 [Echinococcus granulosus]EUB59725.1 hypothetical protein EGR_05487 [Echinococcus granulosus]
MSENPKWSSLLSNHNQIKRRRPLIHDDEFPNTNANSDISLAISDNPDNGASTDNEHDIVVIESDSSDNNKENEEIEGENISRHEDSLGFVFSSDSDNGNEESHEDQVLLKPFAKREVNTKLDCFISAVGDIPHMMEPLELPSKKELRTPLSSRLATLVRRVRSDKVVRLHTHANDSNADNTRAQVFTTNSVFLPSASRSIRGHVVATVIQPEMLGTLAVIVLDVGIAFLVKLSNGSLSMLLLPSSVCRQWPRDGGDESSASSRMTVVSTMDPGCVYSVKTLPVVTTASDAGLTKKAQKVWSRLPDFLKCDERLAQFVSSNDASNELDLFVLKKAAKFHLVLEMTAFSETTFFLPYSVRSYF